jgi:hypothetical protein
VKAIKLKDENGDVWAKLSSPMGSSLVSIELMDAPPVGISPSAARELADALTKTAAEVES